MADNQILGPATNKKRWGTVRFLDVFGSHIAGCFCCLKSLKQLKYFTEHMLLEVFKPFRAITLRDAQFCRPFSLPEEFDA